MRRVVLGVLLALAASAATAAGPATEPVRYRVQPQMVAGALSHLAVEVRLRGDADGETVLELPGKAPDGTERWRLLSGLTVEGAVIRETSDDRRVLAHAPSAQIDVRYRISSAYGPDAPDDNPPLKGPMLRSAWLMAPGSIFVTPEGRDNDAATFRWGRLPGGWKAASNLDHGAAGQPMTVQNVYDGILVAGRDITLLIRPIAGARLRVAVLGRGWRHPPEHIADTLARVIVGQRSFWRDLETPFFVAVTPLAPTGRPNGGSVGGFGRWQGFALFAATDSSLATFEGNIAHEHTHTWIPIRIGGMPNGRAQVGEYWLSEGLTEFFGDRAALRSGVWSTEAYIASLNRSLGRYGASPIRNAPNSEVLQNALRDRAFTLLPYDRGRLLALIWDRRIADATGGGRRLDDVVFAMRDRFVAAPTGQKPALRASFLETYRSLSGIDLADDVARYVERGETVTLPEDLFAPCARIVTAIRDGRAFQQVNLAPEGGSAACAALMSGAPPP